MDYRYQHKQHMIGLEANLFGRDPQPGESTEAYRVSAYWTMEFDRPASAVTASATPVFAAAESGTVSAGALTINLAQFGPGVLVDVIRQQLELANIKNPSEQAGFVVYETSVLPEVFRRQRLALEYAGPLLMRSAVIIDFDDVGDRDSNVQTYERIRQALIREYGNPSRTLEEGEFSQQIVAEVNDQRFIRITEWSTDKGTLRFGIPRRLDGQVRMEIQHSIGFPSPRDTLWSVEAVR
jgi:hypothetical protein